MILSILPFFILLGCNQEENDVQQVPSIYGTWAFDTLKAYDISPKFSSWLRDFNLSEWRLLEFTLDRYNDDTLKMTTSNSPDGNIFPPSSLWVRSGNHENVFKGKVEDLGGIENSDFRDYYDVSLNGNDLNITVLLLILDCPDDPVCILPVCCDVRFTFRKTVPVYNK